MIFKIFPDYLPLDTATFLLREKCGQYVNSDLLLQHAHEGNIELFALVRETVYFLDRVEFFLNCRDLFPELSAEKAGSHALSVGSAQLAAVNAIAHQVVRDQRALIQAITTLQKIRRISDIRDSLVGKRESASNDRDEPESKSPYKTGNPTSSVFKAFIERNLNVISKLPPDSCRECFSIADYVPLGRFWSGRIFASKHKPRAVSIVTMVIQNRYRPIFTATDGEAWHVTENDLFVRTKDLNLLLEAPALEDVVEKLESRKEKQDVAATPRRKKELIPLTIRQIKPEKWPCSHHVNLRAAMANSRDWLKEARVSKGAPGKSAIWNPARLALCLLRKAPHKCWTVKQQTLEEFLIDHFQDWMDEWYQETEQPSAW